MCGFVGVVRDPALGPVTREELEALLPDLAHRGPDGSGVVVGNGVGLAATRLAIQGDHRSDQPLVVANGRLALAFNGELLATEQETLRRALRDRGRGTPDVAAGDTALLGALLASHFASGGVLRDDAPAELCDAVSRSMGALAVIDREEGSAFLVRDRLGVKPLFVLDSEDGTWFSSLVTPLLRISRERERITVPGLSGLVRWHEPYTEHSLPFWDVTDHTPGTSSWIPHSGCPSSTVIDRSRFGAPPRGTSGGTTRFRFTRTFERVAREAADIEGPLTVFLSGGIDSAAVAVFCGRPDVLAITGRFEPRGGDFDESDSAASVCRTLGLRHDVVDLRDADLVADLEPLIRALELPMAGPGSLALWRLAMRAREYGRVVLTGTGGDELLGGYVRTALALGRRGAWTTGYEGLVARMPRGLPAGDVARALRDRRDDLLPLLDPVLARRVIASAEDRDRYGAGSAHGPGLGGEPIDEALEPELRGTLPSLLHVEDRVLMAHGLEGRPVFCLGDVPDAALALHPDDVIGPDGEGKVALRALLKGRIPESVRLDKRKRGFPTPFARAARGAGRERVEAILSDRRFRERGWWNVAACRALLDEERPAHDRALFALLSWEIWARLFVDGDALREPARPAPSSGAPAR